MGIISAIKDILKYIPGFRSNTMWKKVVASIYYAVAIITGLSVGFGQLLILLAMPFLVFSFVDLIQHKKKGIPLKKALPVFLLAFIVAVVGACVIPAAEQSSIETSSSVPGEESVSEGIVTSTIAQTTASALENETETEAKTEITTQTQMETETTASATQVISGTLSIHFIDVGQGDSILIQQGDRAMLIDAGENNKGSLVVNYLKEQGVSRLDYVIGTHPHSDHIGGLDNVINSFEIGKVILPDIAHTTQTFEDLLLAIKNNNLKITKAIPGDTYTLGDAKIEIRGPIKIRQDNLNNNSVVCMITYGSTKFLFAGDAEQEEEADILSKYDNLSADVLKIGHHGSSTASSQAFLNAVKPAHAVIMCGKENKYGHPAQQTLDKLAASNIKVYRTDLSGTIIATTDGKKIDFNKEPKLGTAGGSTSPPTTKTSAEKPKETTIIATTKSTTQKTTTTAPAGPGEYIGNKNTKKFHLPTCKSLPAQKNRVYFDSREEAIKAGYEPCKNCNP